MRKKIQTIGILTGGGDCPGLNAVIRAVVKAATVQHGWKVLGIQDGYDGLVCTEKVHPLGSAESAAIQSASLEEAVGILKTVQPDSEIVQTARALGISFGD